MGVALGLTLWIVLTALALFEGVGSEVFSLPSLAGHVRLLVAIPLFFLCESVFFPSAKEFMRTLVQSRIVHGASLTRLEAASARIERWKKSWLPEAICLGVAILMSIAGTRLNAFGATAAYDAQRAAAGFMLTGGWYWSICMTIFRFLLLRWLWQLLLWWSLLYRLSRLPLNLLPAHADGAGGLGYLEVVHAQFIVLIVAISAIESASFAEGVAAGTMVFEAIYPALTLVLVGFVVLFLGPLYIFAPQLWRCREKGLADYSLLASQYAQSFDRKWLGVKPPPDQLLGTPDVQSLSDLTSVANIVRRMRLAPISLRLLLGYAAAALLPMLPLLLLKFPAAELAKRFLLSLSGL